MNKKQKLDLKSQSHKLKPVVIIGANELTEGVHQEIECALDAHELIKIRINADNQQHRKQILTTICQQHQAELINQIGHIAVIYRKAED